MKKNIKKSKKKKKNNNNLNYFTVTLIGIFVILLLLILVVDVSNKDEVENVLEEEGYYTETEDAFYKKILTNNTLEEYYNDVSNKRNSQYIETYISKNSYEYIKLIMKHQEELTTTLSISSDLNGNEVDYNFELSYKKSHLILEGINDECETVVNTNVKKESIDSYCTMIKREIETYNYNKNEILNNQNIMSKITKQ